MRKIINSTYISLDGVIEGPHLWPALRETGDDTAGRIQSDLLFACDAVLVANICCGFVGLMAIAVSWSSPAVLICLRSVALMNPSVTGTS